MQLTMPEKKAPKRGGVFLLLLAVGLLAGGGLVWWHFSGRLVFDGEVRQQSLPLVAAAGGRVIAVDVAPGEAVRRGQLLLRLDETGLQQQLAEARQRLAATALTLPPQYLDVPGEGGVGRESLSQRLERRRLTEEKAMRRVEEASDREAQAAVTHSRAAMLAARGKLSAEELRGAELALEAARAESRAAREAFEQLSLGRAETSMDIRRLKETQQATGANLLPVETRLAAYENARQAAAAAEEALAFARLTAPVDGLVREVSARPGDILETAQTAIIMQPSGAEPEVRAALGPDKAARLAPGLPCRIALDGPERRLFSGYVLAVGPAEKGGDVPVRVALLAEEAGPKLPADTSANTSVKVLSVAPLPADGTRVEVTALLREPLLARPQGRVTPAALPEAASGAPGETRGGAAAAPHGEDQGWSSPAPAQRPGQAAPPLSPLSVETPFGGADPYAGQTDQAAPGGAGSGASAAGAAVGNGSRQLPQVAVPQLPPMSAPPVLKGSPMPDPANNPSLATPENLEREGAAPR